MKSRVKEEGKVVKITCWGTWEKYWCILSENSILTPVFAAFHTTFIPCSTQTNVYVVCALLSLSLSLLLFKR